VPSDPPWLSPGEAIAEVEVNPSLLGDVLREYRKTHGINQADLAQILNLDQSYVSKIETGQRQVRDVVMLLQIAQQLDVAPARLGISDDSLRPVAGRASAQPPALAEVTDPVATSQAVWRATRRYLNGNRGTLARAAAELYRPDVRLPGGPLIAQPRWIPDRPVRLEDIELEWADDAAGAPVTGGEPEAVGMLPFRAPGQRYQRYTAAIRYLDRPALFENRPSYRLLDVALPGPRGRMRFGLATYFDKLDVAEAVAHELARADEIRPGQPPPWAALPLRAMLGDPFDLGRRFVLPAIETLTLRRDRATGAATFLLHWRDPAKVATAAGVYGLIPAGEFQPSSVAARDRRNDFDLWRSIVREYSEEILGEPERDGSSGEPLDYENWPLYRTLRRAREQDQVSVHCLGVGLDTLTLTATILTVAVFDDDVFDDVFGGAVLVNAEGVLITAAKASSVSDGIPFTSDAVHRLLRDEPMASPGACILHRAWHFRDALLKQ
jgi:transcriptional regulator with XRE-family HTH domain